MKNLFDPFDAHVERTKKIIRNIVNAHPGGMAGWLKSCDFSSFHPSTFKDISAESNAGGKNKEKFEEAKELLIRTGISRADMGLKPPGRAYVKGYRNWPYYSDAILHVIEEARRLPEMRCMSCSTTKSGSKIFGKLLVCSQCYELAQKSQKEIFDKIEAAKVMASNWLENHILSGGLLKGSDGLPNTGLPIHVQAAVQELQGRKAAQDGGVPVRGRKRAAV